MRRVLVLRIIFSAFFPLPFIAMVFLMAAFLVVAPDFSKGDLNDSGSVAVEDVTAGDNPGGLHYELKCRYIENKERSQT